MKTIVSSAVLLCTFYLLVGKSIAFAETTPANEASMRLNNPFALPQTSFYLGNIQYQVNISNNSYESNSQLDESGITAYGFDIEVNHSRFMNIGAYFRVESSRVNRDQDITQQFSTLLGGFTRFYYVPSFFRSPGFTANIFTRLELGAGPTFFGEPSGIVGQGGAHVGIETYFNKWFGLSLSYGKVFEYGKETIASGSQVADYNSKFKGSTFWNHGSAVILSFKTTYF
jgi:hypothetical protein